MAPQVLWVWVLLAWYQLRLRLFPAYWNKNLLLGTSLKGDWSAHASSQNPRILKQTLLVRWAASHHVLGNLTCLRRSLVLRRRLAAKGISTQLVYGVRRNILNQFEAHAWLEYQGSIVDSYLSP